MVGLQLLFVAKEADALAKKAVELLQLKGYQTELLGDEQNAPLGAVAIYSGYNDHFPHKHTRLASHRLKADSPPWTHTTPFIWSMRENRKGNWTDAVISAARQIERWVQGKAGAAAPWMPHNSGMPSASYQTMLEEWFDSLADVIGEKEVAELIGQRKLPDRLRGRGGDIVYHYLQQTGRVLLAPGLISQRELPPNQIFQDLLGLEVAPVNYGTTDLANIFELLQLVKLGVYMQRPAVFELYPSAHNFGYWYRGFLNPSLALTGQSIAPAEVGLNEDSKYSSTEFDAQRFAIALAEKGGLSAVYELIASSSSLAECYQLAMQEVVKRMLHAVEASADLHLLPYEQLLPAMGYYQMSAKTFALKIQDAAGHPVNAFNLANGLQVKTDAVNFSGTVEDLHKRGGWLGGAGIYLCAFEIGLHGGSIAMIKDSSAGRVNKLALPYLKQEASRLYVSPVGLFRLTAAGQNPDWSIDPLVLLQLLDNWGPSKANEELRRVWDAMEVPLARGNIGKKTVATVTSDGINIAITQS